MGTRGEAGWWGQQLAGVKARLDGGPVKPMVVGVEVRWHSRAVRTWCLSGEGGIKDEATASCLVTGGSSLIHLCFLFLKANKSKYSGVGLTLRGPGQRREGPGRCWEAGRCSEGSHKGSEVCL